MRRTTILFVAVFLMQFGGSAGGTGLPLMAKFSFDASVWTLALIGMVQSLMYAVSCLAIGSLVGKVRPLNAAMVGAALQGVTFVVAMFSRNSWDLFFVSAAGGVGQALFWPMIEGVISEGSDGARLNRRIGFFNVSWSAADAGGTAAAGVLFKWSAWLPFATMGVAMASTIVVVRMACRRGVDGLEALPPRFEQEALPTEGGKEINGRFRKAAWVGNFIASGATNIVRSIFAAPAKDVFRMSSPMIGLALAMMSILRTVTFAGLREWPGWHYSGRVFMAFNTLLAIGLVGVVAAVFLPTGAAVALVFVSFSAIGVGIGMTYYSSIFYAVDTEAVATATARLHEAILGAGAALAVLVAGGADRFIAAGAQVSPAGAATPFALSAAIVAGGMALSGRYIRGNGSRNVLELETEKQYSEGANRG